jgi:hypothetical protein
MTKEANKEKLKKQVKMDITKEVIKAMYFDGEAIMMNTAEIKQINSPKGRYYFKVNEQGEAKFYISITTLINRTTPTNEFLIKWIADMGYDKAKEYTRQRAVYGTAMHTYIAWLIINRQLNFAAIEDDIKGRMVEQNIPLSLEGEWKQEIKKDLLAFATFIRDTNFKPLAVEIALASEKGYAGMIDLVGEIEVDEKGYWGEMYKSGKQKGEPKATKKRITKRVIVDMKSGRKGFHADNYIQLEGYRRLWNENYPDYPIEAVYNWSPKDWRQNPSYNLTEQTDKVEEGKFNLLVQIAMLDDVNREKKVHVIEGIIDLDNTDTIDTCHRDISLLDFAKQPEQEAEQEAAREGADLFADLQNNEFDNVQSKDELDM